VEGKKKRRRFAKRKTYFPRFIFLVMEFMSPEFPLAGCSSATPAAGAGVGGVDIDF